MVVPCQIILVCTPRSATMWTSFRTQLLPTRDPQFLCSNYTNKVKLSLSKNQTKQSKKQKTAWYWYRGRQANQWNRIEDPEMNPHTYGHLIFDKGAKTIQWKKDSIFNKWCWVNWQSTCRRMQIDPFLSPCTKLKSNWIKDLLIKPETLSLIEENLGKNLEQMGTGEVFLNRTPIA